MNMQNKLLLKRVKIVCCIVFALLGISFAVTGGMCTYTRKHMMDETACNGIFGAGLFMCFLATSVSLFALLIWLFNTYHIKRAQRLTQRRLPVSHMREMQRPVLNVKVMPHT